MIIGAQLYSVRDTCDSQDGIRNTFKAMKDIGYTSVQVSGFAYDPVATRDAAEEFGLHIGLTHVGGGIAEIINNTADVIARHKALGVDVVGIGYPGGYLEEIDGVRYVLAEKMVSDLSDATKKLNDAGLKLAYHNHALEFASRNGEPLPLDIFFEKTNWNFTFDCGWAAFAGADAPAYIRKYADRLEYVHLKDFHPECEGKQPYELITPIYSGSMPTDDIIKALNDVKTVKVAYVEQDNAPTFSSSWEQMKISYDNIKAKGWIK